MTIYFLCAYSENCPYMRRHLHVIHRHFTERSRKGFILRIGLYLTVASIILSGILTYTNNSKAFIQAQTGTDSNVLQAQTSASEPVISSNSLLIRLKKPAKGKINKRNIIASNINSFKELQKKYRIKKIEAVAIPLKDSNENADIFSWYRITLDEKAEKIKSKYNSKTKQLSSSNTKVKNLQKVIDTVKTDTDVELIEPDYVVSSTQIDITPPSTPQNLTATVLSATSIRLSWNASSDSSGIGVYNVYRNGVLVIQGNVLVWTNTNLTPNTTYSYTVQAQDVAGNRSPQSTAVTAKTLIAPTPTTILVGSSSPTPTSVGTSAPTPTRTPTITPTPTGVGTSNPYYIPNDPYYSSTGTWGQTYDDMWNMKKMNMENAWRKTRGSQSIIVGVIDTGIDRNHIDLVNNMWINSNEILNNGIDDDGNGYIDDSFGWDFAANTNSPTDDFGHGTDVAGVIAATGNNKLGVVGINWSTKIMNLKFIPAAGQGYTSNAIRAIQYGTDMGADVLNNSWGSSSTTPYAPLEDALKYAHDHGVIVIAAAGNNGINALDFSPASSPYVITASATDQNDLRSIWWSGYSSNYGEKVDVAAPGSNVLTTRATSGTHCYYIISTDYCRTDGTSFASPHAAGLAALILSLNPSFTNEQVRQILRSTAVDLGIAGRDNEFGYGRVDAAEAIKVGSSNPGIPAPFITSPKSKTTISGIVNITGEVTGTYSGRYKVEIGAGRSPSTWNVLINTTAPVSNNILATLNTSNFSAGTYTIKLTTFDKNDIPYEFQMFDLNISNVPTVIPSVTNIPSPSTTATPTPTITNTPTPSVTATPTLTPTPTLIPLQTPIISCSTLPLSSGIRWSWNAIPNSISYWLQVISIDGSDWLINSWVSGTSFPTLNATPGVTYQGRVLAGDGIQQSAFSTYINCTMPIPTPTITPIPTKTPTPTPDKTGPAVVITTPLSGAIVPKNANLSMAATATDPSGVARVEFRVNGNRICNDKIAPYSCTWKVPNKVRQHTITVRGYDLKNNSAYVSIKINAR